MEYKKELNSRAAGNELAKKEQIKRLKIGKRLVGYGQPLWDWVLPFLLIIKFWSLLENEVVEYLV